MSEISKIKIPTNIKAMDKEDPLAKVKQEFDLADGLIYLNGNSLGPLMHRVKKSISNNVEIEWGKSLISAWNNHDWINMPSNVGMSIAELIGARSDTVIACDSTSVNIAKLLSICLSMKSNRSIILSDNANFPTDLYVAQGVLNFFDEKRLKIVPSHLIEKKIDHDVVCLLLTHVDYRTGFKYDMQKITEMARNKGVLTIWDLSHSTGAVDLDVSQCGIDFAVGCGYKYLNGGPGAPAFIYVAPLHINKARSFLSGWMGHKKPFEFELGFQPANDMRKFLVGTPPILGMNALNAALTIWDEIDKTEVFAKSVKLSNLFIDEINQAKLPNLKFISPTDSDQRGSHISYSHHMAYEIAQALIENKVIVDYRKPNVIRFGFAPLYNSFSDIYLASKILQKIINEKIYTKKSYKYRKAVT